jgi:hypothetical protein
MIMLVQVKTVDVERMTRDELIAWMNEMMKQLAEPHQGAHE